MWPSFLVVVKCCTNKERLIVYVNTFSGFISHMCVILYWSFESTYFCIIDPGKYLTFQEFFFFLFKLLFHLNCDGSLYTPNPRDFTFPHITVSSTKPVSDSGCSVKLCFSVTSSSSPVHFLCCFTVVMTAVRGLLSLSRRQLPSLLHLWMLKTPMQYPPTCFLASLLLICLQTYSVQACLFRSVCPSLYTESAEWIGGEQVERRPTLLALCLTCESQHLLKWCDMSLPIDALPREFDFGGL